MTNSEKQTRLDVFEIANLADVAARDVFGVLGCWGAVSRARRASSRLGSADRRHCGDTQYSTASAERSARKACAALDEVFDQITGGASLIAEIRGDLRYIEITNRNTGARYALV